MTDRWRPVPGFKAYEISDHGRVRSWRRQGTSPELRDEPRVRRLNVQLSGHVRIGLLDENQKVQHLYIHRLVLLAFVGPPPSPEHQACHFPDRDPRNNHYKNLRWGTAVDNAGDRHKHNTTPRGKTHGLVRKPERVPRGERNGRAVLSEQDIPVILRRLSAGESKRELAAEYGITGPTLRKIELGKLWKTVPR